MRHLLLRPLLSVALGLALLCGAATGALAQTRPRVTDAGIEPPASSIYIGNSFFYYNNSLHNHVGQLITSGMPGVRHRATSVTISGSGFDWHDVDSYFRPNAIGAYSFGANNTVTFNMALRKGHAVFIRRARIIPAIDVAREHPDRRPFLRLCKPLEPFGIKLG